MKGKLYEAADVAPSLDREYITKMLDKARNDIYIKLQGPYTHWSEGAELKVWATWLKEWFGDEV